jgi:hypothetical protein
MSYQTFERPDLDLKNKPMRDQSQAQTFKFFTD